MEQKYIDAINNHINKVGNSLIQKLESENELDESTFTDFGMNHDFYEGKIKAREEAIELIKKVFNIK